MDTATVFTNLTCNQHCGFCTFRRSEDDPAFADPARVRRDIETAARNGARTLVLSGGEPTLRAELTEHAELARRLGIEEIVLETNGMMLSYPQRASELARAGVTRIRIALNASDAARSDRLTETPGAFALTLRGLANALSSGLPVEVSVAVTSANLEELRALADLPALRAIEGFVLRVVTDADPQFVARYDESARAVVAFVGAARENGHWVHFDGRHAVPLCFFPERRRYPELYAGGVPREGHGYARIAACARCTARLHCPGVSERYLAVHGEQGAQPIGERHARFVGGLGRDRRRAVEDELVNDAFFGQGEGGIERVVRIVFHCNQACDFCFVDRTLPAVSDERIETEIARAAAEGVALLSLSGGEPTLHPRLPRFLRTARAAGLATQIQTNAVRCADPALMHELAEAGLSKAFVSLHAVSAELSDELTSAPGTFHRTIAGIDALVHADVAVTLNCVVTARNAPELVAYARFVASRWGSRVRVNFSLAHASTDLVPRDVTPRYRDVLPFVQEALEVLSAAGVAWQGFDGQCGVPLCLAPWLDAVSLTPLPEPNPPSGFAKVAACAECTLGDRCVGVRKTYLTIYGSDELVPIQRRLD